MLDTIVKIKHYVDTNCIKKHENDPEILEFKTTKPKLYSMILDKNCDITMLYNLVKLHENMNKGSISKDDAEKQFGEIAANRYVYPLISRNN